jgi:hypothetical protein
MRSVRKIALFVALGLSAVAACHGAAPHSPAEQSPAASAEHNGEVHSNIARADYAGSRACARCHAKEYAAWLDSPMHRMTRDLHQTQIRAPFAGADFAFREDSVHM